MPRKADHLQFHGGQYRVVLAVPRDVRSSIGKKFLIQPLGTANLDEANRLKGAWLSQFRTVIAASRRPEDTLLKDARMLRHRFENASNPQEKLSVLSKAIGTGLNLAGPLSMQNETGPAAYEKFVGLATGYITPLDFHVEDWIVDRGFIGKTALQHRKAFAVLTEWCKKRGIDPTINAINRRIAWEFIEKELRRRFTAPKTINRYLSSYRTHWRWLMRRDQIRENPWLDTHVSERRVSDANGTNGRKRAFADDEIRALLSGNAPHPLPDLMIIAALTGARINAICELRVRDCQNASFTFRKAKKEVRDRTIPIHSRLRKLVARRVAHKRLDEFLIHELPGATDTRPRSAAAIQAFTRYRRRVGVDEQRPGHRQSNVDFHSFRRWFTTKAEQAGEPPHVIDFVTGHKRPGETLGRYSDGPKMAQLRACVEAVKLPPLPSSIRKAIARRAPPPRRKQRIAAKCRRDTANRTG